MSSLLALLFMVAATPQLAQRDSTRIDFEFKGVRTGMTVDELSHLVATTRWGNIRYIDQNEPIDSSSFQVYLGAEGHRMGDSAYVLLDDPVGSRRRTADRFSLFPCGGKKCRPFDLVIAQMHQGRVMELTIYSEPFKQGDITGLQAWIQMADAWLRTNHGPPEKVYWGVDWSEEQKRSAKSVGKNEGAFIADWHHPPLRSIVHGDPSTLPKLAIETRFEASESDQSEQLTVRAVIIARDMELYRHMMQNMPDVQVAPPGDE